MHTITDTTRLARRLRDLAGEVESADRYGVPIPFMFNVNGHEFGGVTFSATAEEFDAWAEYTEATVEEYEHGGKDWRGAKADVNGLPVSFATSEVSA